MSGGISAGLTAWQLLFQYAPIILSNGIAENFPVPMLPLVAVTEALNFPLSMLSGGSVSLDKMFASYRLLPGSSLLNYDFAKYPFANSTVAANSVVKQPINFSMLMVCPVQVSFGYYEKLAMIEGLTTLFDKHTLSGGTFIVATPFQIYTNCLFRGMIDASQGSSQQPQNTFRLDFEKPLVTVSDAESLMNSFMTKLQNLTKPLGDAFSGLGTAISTTTSVAGPGVIPAAIPSIAAGTQASPASLLASGVIPV